MLFLGQAVYDLTNERVLIYGGTEMYQEQKEPYDCWTVTSFLTEDYEMLLYAPEGKVEGINGEEIPFKYTNFKDGADAGKAGIPVGEYKGGGFFGCLDFNKILSDPKDKAAIESTFAAAKNWAIPKPVKKELNDNDNKASY